MLRLGRAGGPGIVAGAWLAMLVGAACSRTALETDCREGTPCNASVGDVPRCYQTCDDKPDFTCISTCMVQPGSKPTCVGGAWVCPPEEGKFPDSICGIYTLDSDCGGNRQLACPGGGFCSYRTYDDGTCGRSALMGLCLANPIGCESHDGPVCTCGGWVNPNGGCVVEGQPFEPAAAYAICDGSPSPRCGASMDCTGSKFCVRTPTVRSGEFFYSCETVASDSDGAPEVASCDTLDHPCRDDCVEVDGMVIVTCPCV